MDVTNFKFPLGATVRDTVTGFTGIIASRTEWLNRCIRYAVQPKMVEKDGEPHKIPEQGYIDEEQLELLQAPKSVAEEKDTSRQEMRRTGGDRESPQRAPYPER